MNLRFVQADFDEVGVGVGGEDVGHFAAPVDGLGAAVDFEAAVSFGLDFAGFAEVDEFDVGGGGAVGEGNGSYGRYARYGSYERPRCFRRWAVIRSRRPPFLRKSFSSQRICWSMR